MDAAFVQNLRRLAFGVTSKQLIEHLNDFRTCLSLSEVTHGQRQCQRGGRSTSEAHVCGDVLRFDQRHVFDYQTDNAFALALRSLGIMPDCREVLG